MCRDKEWNNKTLQKSAFLDEFVESDSKFFD